MSELPMDLIRDQEEPIEDFMSLVDEVTRYQESLVKILEIAKNKNYPVGTRIMKIVAQAEKALNEKW